MAENDKTANVSAGRSGSADLVSLDEAQGSELDSGSGASSQDSILNAAEMFQAQLEQMTAWKHQLAQQMEVMRRDGIKLLERQKALAIEKKRASDEREALVAERTKLEKSQQEIAAETERLTARAAEIEAAQARLSGLEAEKAKWETQLDAARRETESLASQKDAAATELAAAEARLSEIKTIEGRRDELAAQVSAAEARLATLTSEQQTIEAARHALAIEQAELAAKQKAIAEQEAHLLSEDIRLKEGLEQLELQRRQLAEAQRQTAHDHEAIEAQRQELAAKEAALATQAEQVGTREAGLQAAKAEIVSASESLKARETALEAREREIGEKAGAAEEELHARMTAVAKLQQQAAEERISLSKQRADLQRKLDSLEQEQAEQLESLAKQTKRLTERRAEIEAAEKDLEAALEGRIAAATGLLKEEFASAKRGYEQKIARLEAQIAQAGSAADGVKFAEAALQKELAETVSQLEAVRAELQTMGGEVSGLQQANVALKRELAEQADAAKREAEQWESRIAEARAQGSFDDAALGEAKTEAAAAREQLAALKSQVQALSDARVILEGEFAAQAEAAKKELEALRDEVAREIASRDAEIAAWKEKAAAVAPAADSGEVTELRKQVATLEQQRNDLAQQLFTIQDTLKRHEQDGLLTKNVLESQILELEQQNQVLEAEKSAWQSSRTNTPAPLPTPTPTTAAGTDPLAQQRLAQEHEQLQWHKERLLQQARVLRSFRQQARELRGSIEAARNDVAQQREQVRARKENLEQVKRLLEKQEMVMARKLADHNAIKTVAAVGIFVIMVLGSAFFGVYKFVSPVYRSEAVVQLAPPQGLAGPELDRWLGEQMGFLRTNDVTYGAWKILRSADEHYAMHDVRDEWLASLGKNLSMQLDPATKTLAIRYSGPDATGVSQVCNALAMAYSVPGMRDPVNEQTKSIGLGAQVFAKATVPLYPAEDNRLMLSMSVLASTLFFSLICVMVFRHFIARQLKEIDQMADAEDLDGLKGDLAEGTPEAAPAA